LRALAEQDPAGHFDSPLREFISANARGRTKPYLGIPTLLGAPLQQGVRQIERTGGYHHASRTFPLADARIADIGDIEIDNQYALDAAIMEIEARFNEIVDAGVIPLTVGGDHSISYPILKALGRDEPVGLVHFDAHCDTGPEWGGSKFHHGGPFLNAAVAGVLDPERTIQIGIRGSAEVVWRFSYDSGMTVVHIEDIREHGIASVVDLAREVVGDGPTYISFDVDALDPVYAPGTGTPEVGGLTPHEAQDMIRGLAGLNLIGADVVEVAPQYDPTTNTALVAANMLFEELSVITQSLTERR